MEKSAFTKDIELYSASILIKEKLSTFLSIRVLKEEKLEGLEDRILEMFHPDGNVSRLIENFEWNILFKDPTWNEMIQSDKLITILGTRLAPSFEILRVECLKYRSMVC